MALLPVAPTCRMSASLCMDGRASRAQGWQPHRTPSSAQAMPMTAPAGPTAPEREAFIVSLLAEAKTSRERLCDAKTTAEAKHEAAVAANARGDCAEERADAAQARAGALEARCARAEAQAASAEDRAETKTRAALQTLRQEFSTAQRLRAESEAVQRLRAESEASRVAHCAATDWRLACLRCPSAAAAKRQSAAPRLHSAQRARPPTRRALAAQ